jgi:hypothetical protein
VKRVGEVGIGEVQSLVAVKDSLVIACTTEGLKVIDLALKSVLYNLKEPSRFQVIYSFM